MQQEFWLCVFAYGVEQTFNLGSGVAIWIVKQQQEGGDHVVGVGRVFSGVDYFCEVKVIER